MSYYPSLDEDSASINSSSEDVPTGLGFGIMDQVMAGVESDDTLAAAGDVYPALGTNVASSCGYIGPQYEAYVEIQYKDTTPKPLPK